MPDPSTRPVLSTLGNELDYYPYDRQASALVRIDLHASESSIIASIPLTRFDINDAPSYHSRPGMPKVSAALAGEYIGQVDFGRIRSNTAVAVLDAPDGFDCTVNLARAGFAVECEADQDWEAQDEEDRRNQLRSLEKLFNQNS